MKFKKKPYYIFIRNTYTRSKNIKKYMITINKFRVKMSWVVGTQTYLICTVMCI